MSSAFRITLSILIAWIILSFIRPIIAAIVGLIGLSILPFYIGYTGLRDGAIKAGFGFRCYTFYRTREPLLFWLVVLFAFLLGIVICGLAISGTINNYDNGEL
jgi:hypothetical protein